MSKIGFIGVGLKGAAMAHRLIDTGHELQILGNRNRENITALVDRGATEASSAAALAAACEIVMLCVGTSDQVESRMRGEDGVIAGLSAGSIVIDFGTSLPASTKALASEVEAAGGRYLDAPLGRTPAHAKDGLLNIMCAGDEATYKKVLPVLNDLGENVFHLGAQGAGHTVKLINNFFGMTVANAMAEAFAMADVQGVDRQSVYDVMSAGPLHSGMMDLVKGYAVDGDPAQLAFAIKNAAKDVGYYARMAEQAGVESVMSVSTLGALSDASENGKGDEMVSQMVDYYAEKLKT